LQCTFSKICIDLSVRKRNERAMRNNSVLLMEGEGGIAGIGTTITLHTYSDKINQEGSQTSKKKKIYIFLYRNFSHSLLIIKTNN